MSALYILEPINEAVKSDGVSLKTVIKGSVDTEGRAVEATTAAAEIKASAESKHADAKDIRCVLASVAAEEVKASTNPVVMVVTPDRFDELVSLRSTTSEFLHNLVDADSNFVDVFSDEILGSFSVPDEENHLKNEDTFAFYGDKNKLIFADESGRAAKVLREVAENGILGTNTIAHVIYAFMKQILVDGVTFLGQMAKEIEELEEDMLERKANVDTMTIMRYTRTSMMLTSFYDQFASMAAMLSDNENKNMTHKEARDFNNIATFADRLSDRAESLESYSMQLHELHQTNIDLTQNSIMQTLTVVTVIIAPLTLLTGWFGMNVPLPGQDLPFMWIVLVAIVVLLSVALIIRFARKKWL